jgi:hypothetical protein
MPGQRPADFDSSIQRISTAQSSGFRQLNPADFDSSIQRISTAQSSKFPDKRADYSSNSQKRQGKMK